MSGVEVAGLALGAFPIVIQIISSYRKILTGCDTERLLEKLRTNQVIFRNSIELMLRSIVPPTELEALLNDLEGSAWKDALLKDRFSSLGQDADIILEKTQDIYKTLAKLREKLETRDNNPSTIGVAVRSRRAVKNFFHGPSDKASLERLQIRISEFQTLTKGSAKLALSRNKLSGGLQDLDLIRACVCGLYNALQNGWNCNCGRLHPANIKLDIWSVKTEDGTNNRNNSLKFSFLCADDVHKAQQEHWMTAETIASLIAPIPLNSGGSSAPDRIDDLCTVFDPPSLTSRMQTRRRLGSISDSQGRDFSLFNDARPLSTHNSGRLGDFFETNRGLNNRTRVQLALKLAWAVLQMSHTGWLEGKWTKENVLIVLAPPDDPLAYISHRFQSARQKPRSPTLVPTALDLIADWTNNASLFDLGVFMLEVCYNKSIKEMATSEEKNLTQQPILTALRLAKTVDGELGVSYAQAIRACLSLPPVPLDAQGKPKDYNPFAKEILLQIINPLRTTAEAFGA